MSTQIHVGQGFQKGREQGGLCQGSGGIFFEEGYLAGDLEYNGKQPGLCPGVSITSHLLPESW